MGLQGVGVASLGDIYGVDASPTFFQAEEKAPTTAGAAMSSNAAPTVAVVPVLSGLRGINPLLWLPILLGVLVLVKVLREWESAEPVHEVKVGAYFVAMSGLSAIIVIPLVKALLQKYQIPGLSAYVANA